MESREKFQVPLEKGHQSLTKYSSRCNPNLTNRLEFVTDAVSCFVAAIARKQSYSFGQTLNISCNILHDKPQYIILLKLTWSLQLINCIVQTQTQT